MLRCKRLEVIFLAGVRDCSWKLHDKMTSYAHIETQNWRTSSDMACGKPWANRVLVLSWPCAEREFEFTGFCLTPADWPDYTSIPFASVEHPSFFIRGGFYAFRATGASMRRITCGLGILSLMILPVRSISAQEDSPEIQANRFNPRHSHLSLEKSGENFIISSGLRT